MKHFLLGLLSLSIAACATRSGETRFFEDFYQVRDTDTMQQIALTLPVFESRNPKEALENGSLQVLENTSKRWRLAGDAAQSPVLVERLPAERDHVLVQVTTGPSESGVMQSYQMKRYAGGWERSRFKTWTK
jgi:hypothetical protein